MKLTYRGAGYDYTPAVVESHESAIAGKYRGAGLKFRTNLTKVPVLKSALDLIYRGTHYRLGDTQPTQAAVAEVPTTSMAAQPTYRGLPTDRATTQLTANVHPESIAEQVRLLVLQDRQKAAQREMSVLERFEEAIGAPVDAIAAYDIHEAAMS
jgi:hypothetical protein